MSNTCIDVSRSHTLQSLFYIQTLLATVREYTWQFKTRSIPQPSGYAHNHRRPNFIFDVRLKKDTCSRHRSLASPKFLRKQCLQYTRKARSNSVHGHGQYSIILWDRFITEMMCGGVDVHNTDIHSYIAWPNSFPYLFIINTQGTSLVLGYQKWIQHCCKL